MSNLDLTNTIYGLLIANTGLTRIISRNVFPIISPAGTLSPVVILKTSFSENYSKDGGAFYNSTVEFRIYSTTYNQLKQIAVIIDGILNFYASNSNNIKTCRITNADEDWNENDFIQNLTYELKNI